MMKKALNFEMVYRQNYEAIYKFCFRMLSNHEIARDTTQESFIKLHERMDQQGAELENTKAWLYKVAGNLCLNSLQKTTRHQEIENTLDLQIIENKNPENIFIQNEKASILKRVISKLEPDKQALILMYQDGLSYQEMSEATGINVNSVGKTLWRIIHKLSENIKLQEHE